MEDGSGKLSVARGAPRLARAEIELLCLLHAVGSGRSTAVEVTGRLGLSLDLAGAIARAARDAVGAGWLALDEGDGDCERFVVTDVGRDRLSTRLAEFGVAGVN